MYTVFVEKRPVKFNDPDAPFYLANVKSKSTDKCWFKCNAVGINKPGSLMKEMSRKAGLENDKLRNHNARKTMIQTLSESDVPPTQIAQLSGHKSLKSIENYTREQSLVYLFFLFYYIAENDLGTKHMNRKKTLCLQGAKTTVTSDAYVKFTG